MSQDIEDIISEKLKNANFALQVDKSTDITSKVQLLAFVQFENESRITENFFCCKMLTETVKG